MQTDFHHAVTYALARLAGFDASQASVISHAAQYVDDATEEGAIGFDNGARYSRISSAHRMLDYRNVDALAASRVWLPFHFLPGNMGLGPGEAPDGPFIRRLVTIPNSAIAKDMLRATFGDRSAPWALHRLGIAMHVYADTWAHQGFAGIQHEINVATDLTGENGEPDLALMDKLKNYFVSKALPLGHGAVLSHPDRPYLVWAYTNGLGERISRNNPDDYMDASENMVRAMQRFREGDADGNVPGIPAADRATLERLFRDIRGDETQRHHAWLHAIAEGAFSFGGEQLQYVAKGEGSWKHAALGAIEDDDDVRHYSDAFLQSDWKMFHDALIVHRFDVVHRILPRYGICTA